MMFLVGFLTGIVVASVVIWLWLLYEASLGLHRSRLFDPRGDVSGLERLTIHQMLAAEMAVQRQRGPGPDDVEGTASEITRRP
jgi:hypothetical protein